MLLSRKMYDKEKRISLGSKKAVTEGGQRKPNRHFNGNYFEPTIRTNLEHEKILETKEGREESK